MCTAADNDEPGSTSPLNYAACSMCIGLRVELTRNLQRIRRYLGFQAAVLLAGWQSGLAAEHAAGDHASGTMLMVAAVIPQTIQTLDCAQKLVVTLSVDTGDTVSNSDLQFGISCVNR
jgi:hypothetical protein